MLEGEKPNEEALRKQHEALEISIYAREVLNPEKFEQFCRIVVNDTISNKQKFMELHTLVTGKMELQEMLLDILSAGEAKELGPDVYQQFCIRDTMKRIFRKVKIFYANQPSIFTKILKEFQSNLTNPDIKTEDLIAFGQKHFKENQALLDEFTTFITNVPYPENLLPEPEDIDLGKKKRKKQRK